MLDPDQRPAVVGKLSQVAGEHHARYRFLLATRPLPPAELPTTGWPPRRYELLPLPPNELEPFARRWFTALGVDDPDAVAARFTDLVRRQAIGELPRTPLLASMLCELFVLRPEQDLPSGRAGVYRAFADLLRRGGLVTQQGEDFAFFHQTVMEYGRDAPGRRRPAAPRPPVPPSLPVAGIRRFRRVERI